MWLLGVTVFIWIHHVFGDCLLPDNAENPDFMLELLKSTYKFENHNVNPDAGDTLILTPYIWKNQIEEARNASRVDMKKLLPGLESYAGYLTVNTEYNANLWFWYIPVSGKPVEKVPWIIWLQGGPGVSSLYGLFTEIGPFVVNNNKIEEIKYSWSKNHSLLFIDNPVGTGFSFTEDDRGYATNQTTIGENLYDALQQFLMIFPELRKAPLTLAGESYAGKHIPSLGIQIHWNKNEAKPINLQGLAIGNGFIDPPNLNQYSNFVREVGLLDDRNSDRLEKVEAAMKKHFDNGEWQLAGDYFRAVLGYIMSKSYLKYVYNYLDEGHHASIGSEPFVNFVQQDNIRQALHVGNSDFGSLGKVYGKLSKDFIKSVRPWLEELLENYRVLLYNGHLDIIVAYRPSVNTYNALNFTGADDYKTSKRRPWYHNNTVAGYYKKGGNLTEVMVRGAGHMVPADKPSAALGLISAFIRGISLEVDTGYLVHN